MLQYERFDISEGIDFDKANKSVECMICRKVIGFKYLPYVCNKCHVVQDLKDLMILKIKGIDYSCSVFDMSKKEAITKQF